MPLSSTPISITPLPDRNNLFKALHMLITNDPIARVFAKGVLKAFGAPCPTEKLEQVQQLLQIVDRVYQQASDLSPDEQAIVAQARVMI